VFGSFTNTPWGVPLKMEMCPLRKTHVLYVKFLPIGIHYYKFLITSSGAKNLEKTEFVYNTNIYYEANSSGSPNHIIKVVDDEESCDLPQDKWSTNGKSFNEDDDSDVDDFFNVPKIKYRLKKWPKKSLPLIKKLKKKGFISRIPNRPRANTMST
jgi:hypothetical protein